MHGQLVNILPVGSVEYLLVEVVDRLEALTTLDGYTKTFTVKEVATGTNKYTNEPATNDAMTVKCLVNTTSWGIGEYLLTVKVALPPEAPILGPFKFKVN